MQADEIRELFSKFEKNAPEKFGSGGLKRLIIQNVPIW